MTLHTYPLSTHLPENIRLTPIPMAMQVKKNAATLAQALIDRGFSIVSGGTHTEESWQRQIPVFMQCLGLDL